MLPVLKIIRYLTRFVVGIWDKNTNYNSLWGEL